MSAELFLDTNIFFPEVPGVLAALRGRGLGLAVVSNFSVRHHMVEMYSICTSGGRRVRMPLPKVSIELAGTTESWRIPHHLVKYRRHSLGP